MKNVFDLFIGISWPLPLLLISLVFKEKIVILTADLYSLLRRGREQEIFGIKAKFDPVEQQKAATTTREIKT